MSVNEVPTPATDVHGLIRSVVDAHRSDCSALASLCADIAAHAIPEISNRRLAAAASRALESLRAYVDGKVTIAGLRDTGTNVYNLNCEIARKKGGEQRLRVDRRFYCSYAGTRAAAEACFVAGNPEFAVQSVIFAYAAGVRASVIRDTIARRFS